MSRKLITAQPSFKMLVANLAAGGDPSRGKVGNPVKVRSTFTVQHFPEIGGRGPDVTPANGKTPGVGCGIGHLQWTVPTVPVGATGTVTVANNTFAGPTSLLLGAYVLTTDYDFVVAGVANDTATNLAAAVSLLLGYSAVALLDVVTITGPVGAIGNEVLFATTGSSPNNLTLDPTTGRMSGAEPRIGPVVLG